MSKKVKSQKYWTPRKFQKGKLLIKRHYQKLKHIKRMDNNCHNPDLVEAISFIENVWMNLFFKAIKTSHLLEKTAVQWVCNTRGNYLRTQYARFLMSLCKMNSKSWAASWENQDLKRFEPISFKVNICECWLQ